MLAYISQQYDNFTNLGKSTKQKTLNRDWKNFTSPEISVFTMGVNTLVANATQWMYCARGMAAKHPDWSHPKLVRYSLLGRTGYRLHAFNGSVASNIKEGVLKGAYRTQLTKSAFENANGFMPEYFWPRYIAALLAGIAVAIVDTPLSQIFDAATVRGVTRKKGELGFVGECKRLNWEPRAMLNTFFFNGFKDYAIKQGLNFSSIFLYKTASKDVFKKFDIESSILNCALDSIALGLFVLFCTSYHDGKNTFNKMLKTAMSAKSANFINIAKRQLPYSLSLRFISAIKLYILLNMFEKESSKESTRARH